MSEGDSIVYLDKPDKVRAFACKLVLSAVTLGLFFSVWACGDDEFGGFEQATKPGLPSVASPEDGQIVLQNDNILTVYNAPDVLGRVLFYNFEVYTDRELLELVARSRNVPQGSGTDGPSDQGDRLQGTTSWTVFPPLPANRTYWWRVRARSEQITGDWTDPAHFTVISSYIPGLVSPVEQSVCPQNVELVISNVGFPPDDYTVTYDFEIYADASLMLLLSVLENVPENSGGFTAVSVPKPLSDHAPYWWRARARWNGSIGPWSDATHFSVEAIAILTPVWPIHGTYTLSDLPELIVESSNNICQLKLVYDFELYADPQMVTLQTSMTGCVPGEFELTSWVIDRKLTDRQFYWWRVRSRSVDYTGHWTDLQGFRYFSDKAIGSAYADEVAYCGVTCPDAVIYRDCQEALGEPDYWWEGDLDSPEGRIYHGFVSLGIRGAMILDMGEGSEIVDGDQSDLQIWQAAATEQFQVFVAEHAGGPWFDLGLAGSGWYETESACCDQSLPSDYLMQIPGSACYMTNYSRGGEIAWCDVSGTGLELIRFVRILDQQPWDGLRKDCYILNVDTGEWYPYEHAGADIDAVRARYVNGP
ncbi:hypothetical protein JXQ70_16045 [bacterium]|nr:hypothetical protein [bacterium]